MAYQIPLSSRKQYPPPFPSLFGVDSQLIIRSIKPVIDIYMLLSLFEIYADNPSSPDVFYPTRIPAPPPIPVSFLAPQVLVPVGLEPKVLTLVGTVRSLLVI